MSDFDTYVLITALARNINKRVEKCDLYSVSLMDQLLKLLPSSVVVVLWSTGIIKCMSWVFKNKFPFSAWGHQ